MEASEWQNHSLKDSLNMHALYSKINHYLINFAPDSIFVFFSLIQIIDYLVIELFCIIQYFLYLPYINCLGSVPGYTTTKHD